VKELENSKLEERLYGEQKLGPFSLGTFLSLFMRRHEKWPNCSRRCAGESERQEDLLISSGCFGIEYAAKLHENYNFVGKVHICMNEGKTTLILNLCKKEM
jgi:hypothetical protein